MRLVAGAVLRLETPLTAPSLAAFLAALWAALRARLSAYEVASTVVPAATSAVAVLKAAMEVNGLSGPGDAYLERLLILWLS